MQRIDIRELPISDWGDIETSHGNFEETTQRIKRALKEVAFAERYLFIGGDHTITIPIISFFSEKIRKYVHLDAHADFEDSYLGSKYTHGSVLRRVGEIIGWEKIVLVGLRSVSKNAMRELEEYGVEYYTSLEIREDPRILEQKLQSADYISLDIDVIDPPYAPEVANPEPLGLEPLQLIKALINVRPKIVDVVEVVPKDHTSITAILAATIIREVLIAMTK